MPSRLCHVADWETRAAAARFNVTVLSLHCGVSRRLLQKFIFKSFGVPPHEWMLRIRMQRAALLLRHGLYVKAVSQELGFKQSGHFSREFKRYYGMPPSHFSIRVRSAGSHLDK
jgi:AraC family transcriptional regulator